MPNILTKTVTLVLTVAITTIITSALFGLSIYNLPDGFATHTKDLPSFIILTVLYSVLTLLVAIGLDKVTKKAGWFSKLSLAFFGSVFTAIVWAVISSQLLWLIMREIDLIYVPIVRHWAIGGAISISLYLLINQKIIQPGSITWRMPRLTIPQLFVFVFLEIPLAFILLFYVPLFLNWTVFVEPEYYLIPDGYQGPVMIAYDRPDGTFLEYEGRARVYRVPESGVFLTTASKTRLAYKSEFYYIDQQNERTEITFIQSGNCDDSASSDQIVVCRVGFHVDSSFQGYVIGKSDELEKHRQAFEELFYVTFQAAGR